MQKGSDRPGKAIPTKGFKDKTVKDMSGSGQSLGKAPNAGPFGVGGGYGPPGADRPKGRYYPKGR